MRTSSVWFGVKNHLACFSTYLVVNDVSNRLLGEVWAVWFKRFSMNTWKIKVKCRDGSGGKWRWGEKCQAKGHILWQHNMRGEREKFCNSLLRFPGSYLFYSLPYVTCEFEHYYHLELEIMHLTIMMVATSFLYVFTLMRIVQKKGFVCPAGDFLSSWLSWRLSWVDWGLWCWPWTRGRVPWSLQDLRVCLCFACDSAQPVNFWGVGSLVWCIYICIYLYLSIYI